MADQEASDPAWDDTQVFVLPGPSLKQEVQLVQRVRRYPESGRLVDFCVSIQTRDADVDEGWCDVERVDCAHGVVHVDRDAGGASEKDTDSVPPDVRDDLDKAYAWALDYIWDVEEKLGG